MNSIPRRRYILIATASYAVLASAWIFLSDRLLSVFTDVASIVWLSTAKGIFFVTVTTALLFVGLRTVPAAGTLGKEPSFAHRPTWFIYLFAVLLPLSMLVVMLAFDSGDRPSLILLMLPIIVSALLGGAGPGLVSTAVAALGVDFLALQPLHSLRIASSQDLLRWTFFLANGVAVSLLSGLLIRSKARAEIDRSQLNAVVSGTSDAIFLKDLQGRYLMINAAGAQTVGMAPDAVIGKNDMDLFPATSAQALMELDRAIMDSGKTQTHEERVTTHDGLAHVFLTTKGPVFDTEGLPKGVFGIARDITERQRVEAALHEREQRLARVIEGSDQGYWDWNLQTNQFQVSARSETMLGYAPGEMDVSIKHWADHVHPDDVPLTLASIQCHVHGETDSHVQEFRARTKSGEWRWILTRGRIVLRNEEGRPLMMSGTHTDISERKQFELEQREAVAVFTSSQEGIMVVNPERCITKINPAFTCITGYEAQEVVGQSPRMLSSGQHDPAFYRDLWMNIQAKDFWRGEIWNRRKSGELYAEMLSISVVRDAAGAIQHYIGVFSDISQFKAHEAEIDRIAHYDPLTGTPNRRLLTDRLDQSIVRAARSGKSLAVSFLDLDGFKAINDQYGHAAGDQLLVGVVESLKHVLRGDDTLARLGGDEFVLLLSDIGSPEECAQVLDRVLHAVSAPIQIGAQSISVSASIGVSLYPQDNADADTLLRHADQSMYLAKEAGKNCYHLFDPESDRKAQVHRNYLEILRKALDNDEFVLYYQPKVDLLSGNVFGAEALIRWRHPEKGLLSPAEFLPHVNGSDLEQPLGDWVIRTAMDQAAQWNHQGLTLCVSANVSAHQLMHADFCERLRAALALHPEMPASCFELEVLETAAIADMEQAIIILQRCRELGVHFALDDFGTGYSSLTYLRKLPVDMLKIDQSFVRDMLIDADDRGIVEGVIRLAAAFNRKVIAEGVETLEHGAALLKLGCSLAQGYGIARPMPAEQFVAWVAHWEATSTWRDLKPLDLNQEVVFDTLKTT